VEEPFALEATDITLRYKRSGRGVTTLDLSVRRGEVFGLVGPNGSGKSTLLRVLSTATEPDSGAFRVGGADGLREKRKVRAKLGLMVDRPTHYGDLSGWANAYFFARLYGMEEEKAEGALSELFEYFDLAGYRDDRVKTYSYGMGKKLALIEALAHGPDVLLLDEPSLGLAPRVVEQIAEIVRTVHAQGTSVLLVEQNAAMALAVADYGYVLENGRVVRDGPAAALAGDRDIQEFYLGVGAARRRSLRDIKSYRRAKNWGSGG